MTKSRIFLYALIAFLGGVAFRSFTNIPPLVLETLLIAAGIAFGIGVIRYNRLAMIFALVIGAALVGIVRFNQFEHGGTDLSFFYGKPIILSGVVEDEPERTRTVQRLRVRVLTIEGDTIRPSFVTLVTVRRYPEFSLGDELTIQGILEAPTNFGDFDYVAFLLRERIMSVVTFPRVEIVASGSQTSSGKGSTVRLILSRLKHSFENNIDAVVPEPHSAFLKGILLGNRESLPEELNEAFQETGTTHIIALSGYNITLIGRFVTVILTVLTIPFQVSFWTASLLIILFVVLTGASPSAVRAGIMGLLLLVAEREGRLYHIRNALAFAAAVMVYHNPFILRLDAAFQLSFLATLGLVYFSPHVERWFDRLGCYIAMFFGKTLSLSLRKNSFELVSFPEAHLLKLKHIFIETLAAQLMVLPFLLFLFGRVSLVSPFANLLVLIAVPYSMAIGFVTGVLGFASEALSHFTAIGSWMLLEYKIRIIEFFASMPFASFSLGIVPGWVVSLGYVGIGYWLWRNKGK